uniref:Putative secreted protein n=1 Tax=Amblyomma triste TaxID=251400 RepID=A0A023G1F7_AMBTT
MCVGVPILLLSYLFPSARATHAPSQLSPFSDRRRTLSPACVANPLRAAADVAMAPADVKKRQLSLFSFLRVILSYRCAVRAT